jgi:DNA-binding MarR family transcriptional regulator
MSEKKTPGWHGSGKCTADRYLEEVDNPADGRSRLLRMTPLLRDQFARVIDRANAVFVAALKPRS